MNDPTLNIEWPQGKSIPSEIPSGKVIKLPLLSELNMKGGV